MNDQGDGSGLSMGGSTNFRNVVYHLDVDGVGARWGVRHVNFDEHLGQRYVCSIVAACDRAPSARELLEKEVHLHIERGATQRTIHGIVRHADVIKEAEGASVTLEVVPALWLLSQNVRSRVFTDKSVPEVVKAIYEERLGGSQRTIRDELTRSYPTHELLVQYRESDLNFIQRRLEEEGIFFYFTHDGEREEMVLADTNSTLSVHEGGALAWARGADVTSGEGVIEANHREDVGSTDVVLQQFDWTRPKDPARAEKTGRGRTRPPLEIYDHEGVALLHGYSPDDRRYRENDAAEQARMRAEELDLGRRSWALETTAVGLRAGQLLEVVGCPGEMDGRYVVVSVIGNGSATEGSSGTYANTLEVVPYDVPFRPARSTPRPVVAGLESAIVVGPAGQEIHTDEHGRVRIRFPWDREHGDGEPSLSSCWIRVVHPWAGAGFGALFLPRIGMEVAVSFMGGDPDRPIVIGCLYNGPNVVPTDPLPDRKTQSTIRTKSSLHSDGFNELRFEDDAGHEEIYVHAQRDFRKEVLHDRDIDVGNDERIHIHQDRRAEVDGKEHVEVHGTRRKIQHRGERETFHSTLHSKYNGDRTELQKGHTTYREGIFGKHHASYDLEGGEGFAHVVSYAGGSGVNILLEGQSHSFTELNGTGQWAAWSPGDESFLTLKPTDGLVGIKATERVALKTTDETANVELNPGVIEAKADIVEIEATAMIKIAVGANEILITNDGITLRAGGSVLNVNPGFISALSTMVSITASALTSVAAPVVSRGGKPLWD